MLLFIFSQSILPNHYLKVPPLEGFREDFWGLTSDPQY